MTEAVPAIVTIEYSDGNTGVFSIDAQAANTPVWARLKLAVRTRDIECKETGTSLIMSWPDTLSVIREVGSRASQKSFNFRFKPLGEAAHKIQEFVAQLQKTQALRKEAPVAIVPDDIERRLEEAGFTKRKLKPFQLRDLARLLSLTNGANFSVPGAGKTTVTFALHLLTRKPGQQFIVIAPKAATQAWKDVVRECMTADAKESGGEDFTVLDGSEAETVAALNSSAARFIMSYDLMVRQQAVLSGHFATHPVHLVLDESHRMKAGWNSQRGSFLLNIATLPVRRDILTGTPMPQGASDIESQLDFLWPGHGLGLEVTRKITTRRSWKSVRPYNQARARPSSGDPKIYRRCDAARSARALLYRQK